MHLLELEIPIAFVLGLILENRIIFLEIWLGQILYIALSIFEAAHESGIYVG
jgi:hypothetical protein